MTPAEAIPARVQWTVFEIVKVFGAPEDGLARETPVASFGLDSLELAELRHVIEDEFGVAFERGDFELLLTLGDVIDLVVLRAPSPQVGPDTVTG